MPKTAFEKFIFSLMMALAMTSGMRLYNLFLTGDGMTFQSVLAVARMLPLMCAIAMCFQSFLAGPLARKVAFGIVDPRKDAPWRVTICLACCMACCMSPLMSAVATFFFRSAEGAFLPVWGKTVARNMPFALLLQIVVAGPLVRWIFRRMFRRVDVSEEAAVQYLKYSR